MERSVRYTRHLFPARVEEAVHLLDATGVFEPHEISWAWEVIHRAVDAGPPSGYHIICAVHEYTGAIWGIAVFGPDLASIRAGELYWLGVHPDGGRLGIGQSLLRRVIAELMAMSRPLCVVHTSSRPSYAPARRLYEASGFTRSACIPRYYGTDDDLVIYTREEVVPIAPHSCAC